MLTLKRHSPLQELRKLRRTLEQVSLRLAAGQTLDTALRGQTVTIKVSRSLARQWVWLRSSVQSGRLPPRGGVETFAELVNMEYLCRSEAQRRGLSARLQSQVMAGVCLLMMLGVSFLLQSPWHSPENLMALGLYITGFYWLRAIQKGTENSLWRLEWLMFWFHVRSLVECGMTPTQALHQSTAASPLGERVPLPLREQLEQLTEDLRRGELYEPATLVTKSRRLNEMDCDILEHFARATRDGLATAKITRSYCEQYQQWVQQQLSESAERSAYWNFLPLYLCFAPAMFLVLFSQIFSRL